MNYNRLRVGSKEWVDAHYDKQGVLHTPRRDLLLLWQTKGFREGYLKLKRYLQKLKEKYYDQQID